MDSLRERLEQFSPLDRLKRRIALLGGSYTHPDGTIEFDFEKDAGIDPFADSDDEQQVKLATYHRRQVLPEGRTRKVLGYIWLVVANTLSVAIVGFVLRRTYERDPKLTVIIATLGLLFTSFRWVARKQSLTFSQVLLGISKGLDELKALYGAEGSATSEDYAAAEARLKTMESKTYIEACFLGVIDLLCLFALFSAL